MSKRLQFMGLNYDLFNKDETLSLIDKSIKLKDLPPIYRADLNVATVVEAQSNEFIKEYINGAEIVNIDGSGVLLGCHLLSKSAPARITGVDLFGELLQKGDKEKYSIYFLGATEEVIQKVINKVRISYPNIVIAGYRNGYFSENDPIVVNDIKDASPDILFIGMKSPEKELFTFKNLKYLNTRVIIGVGGTFDVFVGKVKRAPIWIQNIGFEWLYRVYQEPKRMWKRYVKSNTKYLFLLLKGDK